MKTLQEEREAIVEEFEKEFGVLKGHLCCDMYECDGTHYKTESEEISTWLRTALLSHEEKVVAMVREEIRKLVKVKDPTRMHNPELGKINGYNKALTDVMNTLPITDEV